MGLSFSCPFSAHSDLEQSLESVIVKSIDFGVDGQKTPVRSISFKGEDAEAKILQSLGSGRMLVEGSVSFRSKEAEMTNSIKALSEDKCESATSTDSKSKDMVYLPSGSDSNNKSGTISPILNPSNPKHEAAIKLQKVYKSFRTRRKLADCAVLIEQSWWKLLDFAELKHSSISFFNLEKHETAISRWSRARTRAAKVGKGLSKNGKARKLALQHWLEAIDPRHRYGHNLHFYYVKWLHSQSKQPFFYWLDIGEGKEINLFEKCPRSKLQQQCIKYLGPMERKAYEVAVEDGKFIYKETGELLDTTGEAKGAKCIFVLSTSKNLYVGKKKKGTFQHSSFLAGGAALAAGRIVFEKGILKAVWPHSGHYRPTPENFQDFISFLRENNVDLTDVKLDPVDDEEGSVGKKDGVCLRTNSSEDDLAEKDRLDADANDSEDSAPDRVSSTEEKTSAVLEVSKSKPLNSFGRKLTNLEIPNNNDLFQRLRSENHALEPKSNSFLLESPSDGDETTEELFASDENYNDPNHILPAEELDETKEEIISEKSILQRINSHKGMKSYQLGKQLSCKWSTGAGPRIGCLRDYPSGLQSHALEQVNLSPRSIGSLRLDFPSWASTPTSFSSEMPAPFSMSPGNLSHRISRHSTVQSSPLCKGTLRASALELLP